MLFGVLVKQYLFYVSQLQAGAKLDGIRSEHGLAKDAPVPEHLLNKTRQDEKH